MKKYTPGPWRLKFGDTDTIYRGDNLSGQYVPLATVRVPSFEAFNYREEESEMAANARLIACAPEMLALLEKMNGWIEGGCPEIESLIAKAKGISK